MKTNIDYYRPNNYNPHTVIFAPYPYGGNIYNTGGRLTYLAEQTGALVLGAHAPGTGQAFVSPFTRRSLHPDRFAETAAKYAEAMLPALDGFETKLGLGDSGRAVLIAHMQLGMRDKRLFTHVLCRDGWNLKAKAGAPENLGDAVRRMRDQPKEGKKPVPRKTQEYIQNFQSGLEKPGLTARLRGYAEIQAIGKLMCSDNSQKAITELAKRWDTPLRLVDFTHGLSGADSQRRSVNFMSDLVRARHTNTPRDVLAPLAASHAFTVEPGNHADITNPDLLVHHVRETLRLTPSVALTPPRLTV